jgi:hypothetical protein
MKQGNLTTEKRKVFSRFFLLFLAFLGRQERSHFSNCVFCCLVMTFYDLIPLLNGFFDSYVIPLPLPPLFYAFASLKTPK